MTFAYDLVVIGAGSGGVRAARMAATYGAKVAIIEEFRVGGTCVIRGCVPKKLYVFASRFKDQFDIAESFGWRVEAGFDWSVLVANKNKETTRIEGFYAANLDKAGVEIIKDRGEIVDAHTVRLVNGQRQLRAKHILVATGSRPFVPAIPGAELGITSNEAFDLPALPGSILIEGGGYIAVEFATIFAGLGVQTTLVYRGENLLRGFDRDIGQGLEEGLAARGVTIVYRQTITELTREAGRVRASLSGGTHQVHDAVMFATGRRANVESLGLEAVGVALNEKGAIAVDAYSQSSVPSIYAVGDVTGRAQLTPVAVREGWYFAETVFNDNRIAVDHALIPTAVFAEPEIGVVGLGEEQAAAAGDIDVYLARFRPMQNALSDKPGRMLVKLITEKDGGRVLGVHILGPGAAEMIQLVAIAVGMGANKADFDRTMALHPSAAEELVTFKAPSHIYRGGKRQEG